MKKKFNYLILLISIFFSLTSITKVFSQDSSTEYKELFKHWVKDSQDTNTSSNIDTLEFIPYNSAIADKLPLHIKNSGTTFQENHIVKYHHWKKCGNELPKEEPPKMTTWSIAKIDDKSILTIVSENRKEEYYISFLSADKLILITKD